MSRSKLFSAAVLPLSALAVMGGCQLLIGLDGGHARQGSGGTGGATSASSSSGGASSSSAVSSSGTGSSSSTGGTGGVGGATSSTGSATSGTGGGDAGTPTCSDGVQNGTETGVDCGGASCAPCPAVVLLAGGTSVLAGVFDGTGWAPTTLAGTTSDGMALAFLPTTGQAVGLMHAAANQLQYTRWNGAAWSPFAALNADAVQGQPAIVATGSTAQVVYWENATFFYKYEAFTAGAWTAAPQPVDLGGTAQPCGPSSPALAPLGAGVSLLFVNGSCGGAINHLFDSDRTGGAWSLATDVAADPSYAAALGPSLVAPASGPELVAAYVQQGTTQIWSATRTAGAWSAPVAIAGALTGDPIALAPLPTSGVVLAYRGTDGMLYTSTLSGAAWSTPAGIASPNVTLMGAPAVAMGIRGATAELAYADTSGVFHARLLGGAWTAPVQVKPGVGFSHVALASGP